MQKNLKIFIWIIILLAIIVWIIFLQWKNDSSEPVTEEQLEKEIVLYNSILRGASSLDDLSKCEELKINDVYNTCVSSIKFRYWEIWMAKTLEDCEKVEAEWNETKEFRQDVCKYNVIRKMNIDEINYQELCTKIINEEIQWVCISNFE